MNLEYMNVKAQLAEARRQKTQISLLITQAHEKAKETSTTVDKKWLTAAHIKKTKIDLFIAKQQDQLAKEKLAKIAAEKERSVIAQQEKAQRIAQSEERSKIYERKFISIARQVLPKETYQMLVDATNKSMGEIPLYEQKSIREAA